VSDDTAETLERAVAEFLDRREREPDLDPLTFAAAAGAPEGLLDALQSALGVEAQLLDTHAAAPERIGPYRIVRRLGHGGMGVVYEVERDGLRFALKRLHPALGGTRAQSRFVREADLLRRLDHPGIVGVVDVASELGEPYLVMDLVDGAPLSEAAREWSLDRRLEAVIEVCAAVEAAHARGLLHRDLKPQNVLVGRNGRCMLVDFGLGAAEDDASLTSTGELLGTPRYMAPEQARGERVDARADVWGLGQILFELALDRPAIDAQSRAEVMRALEAGRLPRPRKLKPTLPVDLERVLLQALAFDRARRYASARLLAEDLERLRAGRPVLARPPGAWSRAWMRARRRPALAIACAVVPLALVALAGWIVLARVDRARERSEAARWHLERAYVAWTRGSQDSARREIEAALKLVPDDPAAHALRGALEPDPPPGAEPWSQALFALHAGKPLEAASVLEPFAERDILAGVVAARALRAGGETNRAAALLDRLVAQSPRSLAAAVERGRSLREAEAADEAVGELRRAVALAPGDVRLRLELAQTLLSSGAIEQGVAEALEAARLGAPQREVSLPELARLLQRADDAPLVRESLERHALADATRSDVHFALAVLHDSDHRLAEAARHYEASIAADPKNPWALVYLGHLVAGADQRRCAACRSAFAGLPELQDRERAGELFAAAVAADRGQDPDLLRTLVFLVRDHDLDAPVIEALESVALGDSSPAGRARVTDALAGLRR
jgi:tetratricopeptide (TPR) repeat protein/predicted Ser/Thr protein kinase